MIQPTINYLSNIYFGIGAIKHLSAILEQWGIKAPLIVTDKGIISAGIINKLELEHSAVFSGIDTNPTELSTINGLQMYHQYNCDGILAIGGGSPIDCAKCIGLLVAHSEPLDQYAFLKGGLPLITANKPKLIAIPTTAGTGSEVGRASLITMDGGGKLAFLSPHLIPNAVICDPELTLGLPKVLTAATGMDALSHNVENFCSPRYNPIADAISLDGLKRGWLNLMKVFNDGQNLIARGEMMMSALQGGLTFQKGLGLVHALSHPLGGIKNKVLHHGTLNAVFMPHVLRFNMKACPEKMDSIADVIGGNSREELPDLFYNLTESLGLPTRLKQMGVDSEDIKPLAKKAALDHCCSGNPRLVTEESCRIIYEAAL